MCLPWATSQPYQPPPLFEGRWGLIITDIEATNRTSDPGATVAADLPDVQAEERGFDTEALQMLLYRALDLTGPDITESPAASRTASAGPSTLTTDRATTGAAITAQKCRPL